MTIRSLCRTAMSALLGRVRFRFLFDRHAVFLGSGFETVDELLICPELVGLFVYRRRPMRFKDPGKLADVHRLDAFAMQPFDQVVGECVPGVVPSVRAASIHLSDTLRGIPTIGKLRLCIGDPFNRLAEPLEQLAAFVEVLLAVVVVQATRLFTPISRAASSEASDVVVGVKNRLPRLPEKPCIGPPSRRAVVPAGSSRRPMSARLYFETEPFLPTETVFVFQRTAEGDFQPRTVVHFDGVLIAPPMPSKVAPVLFVAQVPGRAGIFVRTEERLHASSFFHWVSFAAAVPRTLLYRLGYCWY